jgi:phosphatidylserine/phosphatidylglycerophosphate/cardiolipin synthase-like enzyme
MIVQVEQENHVRMGRDPNAFVEAPKGALESLEAVAGHKLPTTMREFLELTRDSAVFEVEMLVRYDNYAYELEAKCIPFLVQKEKKKLKAEIRELPRQMDIDLAFSECAGFLDAVFVGGMGCQRILSPRPFRSRASAHDIVVNISKTRTQLTERLLESVRGATKEILIVGWLGRFIIPDLKKCVDRGVKVRIVTHRPQEADGTIGVKDKADAFSELKHIAADNVRLLSSFHARMVVIDERMAFVGSMDLDSQALAERDEAAIVSDDDEVVGRARQFFEELFGRGTKPTW